ncbi:MAG: tetratricopeptide repeat protein [Sandaracinaceae bacterium]|nr:tetratricopeptide repeat protein [Sandaracinaceae bacterium]
MTRTRQLAPLSTPAEAPRPPLPRRVWCVSAVLVALLLTPGCNRGAGGPSTTPEVAALDDASFPPTRRAFHGLQLNDPQREVDRARLFAYLDQAGRALVAGNDYDALLEHFALCTDLLIPSDYVQERVPASLAPVALRIVELGSPRGDEGPVLGALEVLRRIVIEPDREDGPTAEEQYQQVAQWGRTSREAIPDFMHRYSSLIDVWEVHAHYSASPQVLDTLAQLHIDRRDFVLRAASETGMQGLLADYPPSLPLQIGRIAPIDVVAVYLRVGDVEGAIRKLREMGLRGRTEAQLLELLQAAERPSEAGAQALTDLAEAYGRTRPEAARGICRRGLRDYPRDTRFPECLAAVSAEGAQFEDATAWYVVAIALDPENRSLYDEALAQLNEFIERGVFDEDPAAGRALTAHARRLLNERSTRFPNSPAPVSLAQIEFLAAMVELHSGHPDSAREHFLASLESNPLNDVLRELGTLETRLGNADTATELLRRALDRTLGESLEVSVQRAGLLHELGDAFGAANNSTQAERMYRQALELYDGTLSQLSANGLGFVQARRGVLLDKLGSHDAARAAFLAAVDATPLEREPYMVAMMQLTTSTEDVALMRELYRRALLNLGLAPEWKVYFALWTQFVVRRAGEADGEEIDAVLTRFARHSPWYGRLAAFGAGQMDGAALVAAASTPGQRAEAHFYAATRAATTGDRDGARREYEAVFATGMVNYVEYQMGRSLVGALGTPVGAAP